MVLLLFGSPTDAQATKCGSVDPGYARLLLANEDLRAYYRLNEGPEAPACDAAGDADGTYRGEYAHGEAGALAADPAPRFSGSGTVRIPSSPALGPTGAMTLEGWVNPTSSGTSETLIRKDGQYLLRLVDGRVVFRVWTSTGVHELVSAPVVRASAFQHLVAVWDGDRMRLYRNSNHVGSRGAPGTLNKGDSDLYLASSWGAYDFLSGVLDEVAIYDAPLSSGTVRDHYTAASPPAGQSALGCGFGAFAPGSWPDGCWRPYSSASPFNRPLPPQPRLAADSQRVVARMLSFGRIQHLEAGQADTPDDYGHPTYWSQPDDPQFTLRCKENWGTCPIEGHKIRVPDAARPAAGSDAHLTVVDQNSGWEYDLWEVRSKPRGGGTLEFSWGGRTRIDGNGLSSMATAAQFGNLAGIVRADELASGRIDHALFAVVYCDAGRAVYPAGGRGRSCAALGLPTEDAPPMGAHLQLAMSPEEIEALAVPAWKKTILRAMATYGMFVGDTGTGSWGLKMESGSTFTSFGQPDPLVEFAQANGWRPYEDGWVGNLRDDVDWAGRLRVIDPCVSKGTC